MLGRKLHAGLIALLLFACTNLVFGEIIWGIPTNGITAGLEISYYSKQGRGSSAFEINVFLKRHGSVIPPPGTNLPTFWGCTNSFCGPIDLRDSDGNEIPLLKSNVTSPGCYPDTLNWQQMNDDYIRQLKSHPDMLGVPSMSGKLPENFLSVAGARYILVEFYLNDYFELKEDKEYQFTVWPKLYELSSTNGDVYQRIDIPPVTIPIQWSGEQ